MLKKLSAAAALVVAIAFATVSITHACFGLMTMNSAVQQSPMNMGDSNGSPCSKEKGDICQSVRDSLLSVKPAISAANTLQQASSLQLSFSNSPIPIPSFSVASVVDGGAAYPAFKRPLAVSYIVLRI